MKVTKIRNIVIIILFVCILLFVIIDFLNFGTKQNEKISNQTKQRPEKGTDEMTELTKTITVTINGTKYVATLEDNASAQEFAKRLPLSLTMSDLHANEKYYYFDESFTSNPQSVGKIYKGDLMLYGNDCIVLFYDTFETSYSYTKIGKLVNPDRLEENLGSGSMEIIFSLE